MDYLKSKSSVLRWNYKILCLRNAVYWLKATVYDWGRAKMGIYCWSLLGLRSILGGWETERFRTKCSEMGQNYGLSHPSTCTYEKVFLSVLQRDSNRSYLKISWGETSYDISQTNVKCHKVTSDLLVRSSTRGIF